MQQGLHQMGRDGTQLAPAHVHDLLGEVVPVERIGRAGLQPDQPQPLRTGSVLQLGQQATTQPKTANFGCHPHPFHHADGVGVEDQRPTADGLAPQRCDEQKPCGRSHFGVGDRADRGVGETVMPSPPQPLLTIGDVSTLRVRVELMRQLASIVKRSGWTQAEAALLCGVTQPRINDLLRGRVSRFSLDALVNIATAIGWTVHFELQAA